MQHITQLQRGSLKAKETNLRPLWKRFLNSRMLPIRFILRMDAIWLHVINLFLIEEDLIRLQNEIKKRFKKVAMVQLITMEESFIMVSI